MIDPVIYTFHLFGREFAIRWYGVIVMVAIFVGALIVERALKRQGEKSDTIWDVLIWVVLAGVVGARLWYVVNATVGGNRYYVDNPVQIINIPQGGLHIFGGFLFGAIALLIYLRRNHLDPWLFLDAIGPAALIGQGIGRLANFINQELYGPPTTLPWGLKIEAAHRLPPWQNLMEFPVETTRFHPTFAYEMLWNFATAGILLWLSRRYEKELKPGAIFAGWLLAAGIGRTWIELFFRPDQPQIPGSGITYSAFFAALMAVAGAVLLMVRYRALTPQFAENWEEEYQLSTQPKTEDAIEEVEEMEAAEETEEPVMPKKTPRTKKASAAKTDSAEAKKTTTKKTLPRRTTTAPRGTRRTARTKKSS